MGGRIVFIYGEKTVTSRSTQTDLNFLRFWTRIVDSLKEVSSHLDLGSQSPVNCCDSKLTGAEETFFSITFFLKLFPESNPGRQIPPSSGAKENTGEICSLK